eukprot:gb/GECG01000925.1/.p1 GENE.gb/GECG01000925.1/~~gb/GECG01000925.1/.p1  ORF type:complete len:1113 (+),score=115.62 gb/GECG01000925.1/:1-3339(+)
MAASETNKEDNPLLTKAHETIRQQTRVLHDLLKEGKGQEVSSLARISDGKSSMHVVAANAIASTTQEIDKVEEWVVKYQHDYNSTASSERTQTFSEVENPKLSLRVLAIAYKNLLEQVLECAAAFAWRWRDDTSMVNHVQHLFLSRLCHPMVMTSLIFESLRHSKQDSSLRHGVVEVSAWVLRCCLEDDAVRKQYVQAILTNQQVALLPSLTVTTEAASMLGSISTYVANTLQQQTPRSLLPARIYEAMAKCIPHCIEDPTIGYANMGSSSDITCGNAVTCLCRTGYTKLLAEKWLEERAASCVPLVIGAVKGLIAPRLDYRPKSDGIAESDECEDLLNYQDLCYLFITHTKTGLLFLRLVPESYRERVILHTIRCAKHVLTETQVDAFTARHSGTAVSFLNQFRNPLFVAFGSPQVAFGLCRYSLTRTPDTPNRDRNAETLKEDFFDTGGRLSVAAEALAEILCKMIPIRHTLNASQSRILCHYLSVPCRVEGKTLVFYNPNDAEWGSVLRFESKVTDPSALFLLNLWLTVWSEPSFITTSDYRLQASLTRLILYAMRTLPSKMFGAASIFTTSVMEGVQSRMSLHDKRTVRLGLRVAQQFSERTALQLRKEKQSHRENDDEQESDDDLTPLQFDDEDLASDSDWSVDSDFTNDWCLSISHSMADCSGQPEASMQANEEQGADTDTDSDGSLEAFEISETNYAKETSDNSSSDAHMEEAAPSRPVYLHDALAGIKDTNSYQRVYVCIQSLPELIDNLASSVRTTNELHRNIQYLLRTLLVVDNYFALEGFEELRLHSLRKAIIKSPVLAVRYLSKVVFAQEQTMGTRLTVLDLLGDAVMELGGISSTARNQPTENACSSQNDSRELEPSSEMVTLRDGSVRPRTKRWGNRSKRSKTAKYSRNSLAEIAGEFFFPFIGRLRDPSSGVDPLGSDSLFLGHLVKYLAIVVEAAYLSPKIQRMAKELFGLIWMIRFHEDVAVRKAVLLALFSVIKVVSTMGLTHDESYSRLSQVTIHGEQGNFGAKGMIQEIENPSKEQSAGGSMKEVQRRTTDGMGLLEGNIGSTFGGDMVESFNWLRATCEHDSNEQCRALASKILQYEPLQDVMQEVLGFTK